MPKFADTLKRLRGDRHIERLVRRQDRAIAALAAGLERNEQALARLAKTSGGSDARDIVRRLERIEKAVLSTKKTVENPPPPPGTSDPDTWQATAQAGELAFHARNTAFRADEKVWQSSVDADWRQCGLQPDVWKGKTVVDVGAGSRLRTLWFDDIDIIVIEPLADQFRTEVEWCDLDRAKEVYSVAGETFVPEVEGRADVVVSINALDHGYDLGASIENISRYLKADGEALISIDLHDKVSDHMHPMIVTHPMMLELFEKSGLELTRTEERKRYHGGEGPDARHYWLRPVKAA